MFAVCCEQACAFAMFCQARAWHRFTWFACLHPRPAQPAGVRDQLAAAVGAEDMLRSAFLATDEASACCLGLVSLCGFWTADATQCATQWLGRGLLALLGPNSRGVASSMKVDCPFSPARALLQAISAEEGCTATAVLMWRDGQGDVCLQVRGRKQRLLVLDRRLWAAASAQPHCLSVSALNCAELTPNL